MACLSNLRQLSNAFQMYCNENKGKCFRYADGLVDPTGETFCAARPIPRRDAVKLCPEATETGTTPYGNAFTAWGGPTGGSIEWLRRGGSYGMNMWLHLPANSPVDGLLVFTSGGARVISPPNRVHRTVRQGVFACASFWRLPVARRLAAAHGRPPTRLSGGEPAGNDMQRFCMARHKRYVNVAFLDGHAAGVAAGPVAAEVAQRASRRTCCCRGNESTRCRGRGTTISGFLGAA